MARGRSLDSENSRKMVRQLFAFEVNREHQFARLDPELSIGNERAHDGLPKCFGNTPKPHLGNVGDGRNLRPR